MPAAPKTPPKSKIVKFIADSFFPSFWRGRGAKITRSIGAWPRYPLSRRGASLALGFYPLGLLTFPFCYAGLDCSRPLSFRLSYFALFAARAPRSIYTLKRHLALYRSVGAGLSHPLVLKAFLLCLFSFVFPPLNRRGEGLLQSLSCWAKKSICLSLAAFL